MKELTIQDIAMQAKVSVTTVSRVLNNKGRVSQQTRKNVQRVIQKTGYMPNRIAVSMKTKQTNAVVVLIPDLSTGFYAQVVMGAEHALSAQGYSTLVFSSQNKPRGEEEFLTGAIMRMIDGVIAIPSIENAEPYRVCPKPLVMVDRYLENCSRDAISIDNFMGAHALTDHLAQKGHRDIAIITGPVTLNVGRERMLGYRQALSDHGIPLREQLCFVGDWGSAHGYAAAEEILNMRPMPTAIYAANAMILEGALRALYKHNVHIPEDISLVGFDNPPLAEMLEPHITVIDRPAEMMGSIAAQILLQRIRGEGDATYKRLILPIELIERASVKEL